MNQQVHPLRQPILLAALLLFVAVVIFLALPLLQPPASTATAWWHDVTAETVGDTRAWTNKLELADINGDGRNDILLASGGDYETPGTPVVNKVLLNRGAGRAFDDVTQQVNGALPMLARVVKVADVNGDGIADIFYGTSWQTQSQLFLGIGGGKFINATVDHLPQATLSIGDAEFGDIDGDGDLDLVLVDWGQGNPMHNEGGAVLLWLNDGHGHFTQATQAIPALHIKFSWDLELADVDRDGALDILVSCKRCSHGVLLMNIGHGTFRDESERLPASSNNYAYGVKDLNNDGYVDLVSINDGWGLQEQVLFNDGHGYFTQAASLAFEDNPLVCDDNAVGFLDANGDGFADVLIASLNCQDRLWLNDGQGHFRVQAPVFDGRDTPGTLALGVADLNGDQRVDVVQGQGERAFDLRVFYATKQVAAGYVPLQPPAAVH